MRIKTSSIETVTDNHKHGSGATPKKARSRLVFALLTIVLLFGILLFPGHPESFTFSHFARLPLEWPLIVLALLLTSGLALSVLRYVLLAVLALLVLLRTADIGSYIAFDRRFSPMVEWHLLGDGWNLASQQVGLVEAALVIALVLALLIGFAVALFIGLGAVGRLQGHARQTIGGLAIAVVMVGAVGLWLQDEDADEPVVQAGLVPELIDRSDDMKRSIVDQQQFITELGQDPLSENAAPQFAALEGLDVAFIFVESYGQSFLLDEDLGKKAEARLKAIESDITDAGLYVRSGWMTSPVRGGRSWLAHASFASGLAITNQARHDRLISSERVSLYSLFSQAGWHSTGLVPAIRESWPEGAWYGFDKTYDFHGMNYQGEPFGWVTMPDQYTLSTFEHTIRQPSNTPVMAEIALISSHVPWTPLPKLLPWESIGDGSVFDGSHRFGEPMQWNDRARVRDMFAKSLDYSLETVGEYLSLHGKGALFVVHGDHQPAAIVAGWGKTADVPIHIISDNPELLERLPADVFTSGILPSKLSRSLPMWSMRELMATVFEDDAKIETNESVTE
ncbi:sulfatase [bacterium]|nr:sulfatase [bacterium]